MDNPAPSKKFNLTMKGEAVKPPSRIPAATTIEKVLQSCNISSNIKGTLLMSTHPEMEGVKSVITAGLNNSFIGALYEAYNRHYAIEIRPDDVWLTIVIAFADYVDNHAEEMRKEFVTFEGKKDLVVHTVTVAHSVDNWTGIIRKFSDLINDNTSAGVRDFLEPRFSTTTENDSLIARVAMMGALKHYFAYGACCECGIPSVTLKGTLEDWAALRKKVVQMGEMYGTAQPQIGSWTNILLPIMDQFIASYNGNVDEAFWQSCAVYKSYGSGPSFISGWACAFSPFEKGNWRLKSPADILKTGNYGEIDNSKIQTSATVEVEVKINDNGYEYDTMMYAGGIVNTYQSNTNTIRPSFDFAMFKVPDGTIKDKVNWNTNK